jgi:hypothetical protein
MPATRTALPSSALKPPYPMEPPTMSETRHDDQGRRLCTATAKSTGKACRAPAVQGATVCHRHGAAKGTPARAAADRVLLSELVGPALLRLQDLIQSPDTSDAVALGAIREILARTRYGEPISGAVLDAAMEAEIARLEAEMTDEELVERRAKTGPTGSA